ncbi:MAG: DMT family transporter [Hyphomicrobiaceae bacterium]|nr:DMT family transporter [Hyphomicrobiaceae bacterium]
MDYLWILLAAASAFFQSLRLAGLKTLNQRMPTLVTTYVRALFGLPLLIVYILALLAVHGGERPELNATFLAYCTASALLQFFGTATLIYLFQLGNFAVGTMLSKVDVIMTALIGMLLFAQPVSSTGWVAILVTLAGVLLVSAGRLRGTLRAADASAVQTLLGRPTQVGLLTALIFGLSYLTLREAILALESGSPLYRAGWGAVTMVFIQFLLLGAWFIVRQPAGLKLALQNSGLCTFIGVTSALGTIFWFSASALQNAAYVAAAAQVQLVFNLVISRFYFGERLLRAELVGMLVIVAGVLLFKL